MKNTGYGAAITLAFVLTATTEMLSKDSDLQWECDNGGKILIEWLCDDRNDCSDGSDENQINCADKICDEDLFRCNNTRCIDISFLCNGEADCLDGDISDEVNCDYLKIPKSKEECAHFLCTNDNDCLLNQWVCDGERDCLDGSDEWNCTCQHGTYGCFVRGVLLCLKNTTRCDNVQHCDSGEDEFGCQYSEKETTFSCPPTHYKCRTDECVPWTLVCDGINDCRDESDEGGLCHVRDCDKMVKSKGTAKKCDQICHNTPDGAMCSCNENYRLHKNSFECVDIDECAEMSSDLLHNAKKIAQLYRRGLRKVCSQKCVNLPGSFRCVCVDGYGLDADGYSCKAKGFDAPDLYIGVGSEIRVISLRKPGDISFSYKIFYNASDAQEIISDIEVASSDGIVFWIEEKSGNLFAKSFGKPPRRFSLPRRPTAIAYEWITKQIYVTSFKRSNYGVAEGLISLLKLPQKSDSGSIKVREPTYFIDLATEGLKRPSALVVYPSEGYTIEFPSTLWSGISFNPDKHMSAHLNTPGPPQGSLNAYYRILVVADDGDLYSFEHAPTRILLVNMDGSNSRVLVDDLPILPTDVIVDDVRQSVIWSSGDSATDLAKVESIKLDGTQRGTIVSRRLNRFPLQPVSIGLFEDLLLIADRDAREVRSWKMTDLALYSRQNTVYESNGVVKFQFAQKLRTILISHPVLQRPLKEKNNKCNNRACSYACVNMPADDDTTKNSKTLLVAKCLCPANKFLAKDGLTCKLSNKILYDDGNGKNDEHPINTNRLAPSADTQITRFSQATPAVTCPRLEPVKHITVIPEFFSMGDTRVGMSVVFKCAKNYEVSRDSKHVITCLQNGKWSSPPPTCIRIPAIAKDTIATTASLNDALTSVLLNKITMVARVNKSCSEIKCGPFKKCAVTSLGATCQCLNGANTANCSPTRNLSRTDFVTTGALKLQDSDFSNPVPATTGFSNVLQHPASSIKSKLLGPLISVIVILFLVLSGISWKYLHKRRHSVDLRYFRGQRNDDTPNNNRQDVLVKESPMSSGKSTSITNPNYTSPPERKRLPKPSFRDDDSGYHLSAGSGSISSPSITTSDSSTSCANEISKASISSSFLLDRDSDDDEKITITNVVVEDSLLMTPSTSGFKKKVGSIFRMRKSESRECMLPKRKGKRKLDFRGSAGGL